MDIKTVMAGLFLALAIPLVEAATIYKTVDDNGNIVFTDTQSSDRPGETINLRPITAIPSVPTSRPIPAPVKVPRKKQYSQFIISQPGNNVTLRNQETITVKLAVSPRMQFDHSIRLRVNGALVAESRRQLTFELKDVERGSHTLTAEIVDSQQQVIESTSNSFFVHRAIFVPEVSIDPPDARFTPPDVRIQPSR